MTWGIMLELGYLIHGPFMPMCSDRAELTKTRRWLAALLSLFLVYTFVPQALAHGVSGGDADFLASAQGMHLGAYFYLGAKHMVTGYDHLLFLVGVIFFLSRFRDVLIFVSLFSLGHSITLLFGVLSGLSLSPYLVDAVIGLSVVYKALDNIGYLRKLVGFDIDPKLAVFGFGLVHGFGLSTKLQDISLSADGLIPNMIAFNLGVEAGQITALAVILVVINAWRRTPSFARLSFAANVLLIVVGFVLFLYQAFGFYLEMTR